MMKNKILFILLIGVFLGVASFFVLKPTTYSEIDKEAFYKMSGATRVEILKGMNARGIKRTEDEWKYYKYSSTKTVEVVLENEKRKVKAKVEFYYVKIENQAIRLYKPHIKYIESDGVVIKPLTTISYTLQKDKTWLMQRAGIEQKTSTTILRNTDDVLIKIKDL